MNALGARAIAVSWVVREAALATPGWVSALVAAAWILVVAHGFGHGSHAHHVPLSPPQELAGWLAMVVAMMVPSLSGNLRDVAQRSYRDRRQRAMVMYLLGYLLVWVLTGLPVIVLRAQPWSHDLALAGIAFVLAAVWASTPLRARFVAACHRRIPLASRGRRADASAFTQGTVTAAPCVATCGWMMVGCALTGHRLPPMLLGAVVAWVEAYQFRPDSRPAAGGALLLAAWCVAPI